MAARYSDFARGLTPGTLETPTEWGEKHIRIPNSARTRNFMRGTVPMINEPLTRAVDPEVRRLIILAPTGGGKTTVYDVLIPFQISNAGGSFLLSMQSDADADEYCEERLMPIIEGVEPIKALMPTGPKARHKKKRNQIVFPHMSLYVGGAGKSNAQRKSVTTVGIDEAWLVKQGMIGEFEKRTHDRWNGTLVVTSQGGEEMIYRSPIDGGDIRSEFFETWQQTDRAEWSFTCPGCAGVFPFEWDRVKYETFYHPDETVDLEKSGATAKYVCACGHEIADTVQNRRALAESGQYVVTNPHGTPGHAGRHYNALTLYWVSWATLVKEWLTAVAAAKDGILDPLKNFKMKRMAEFWKRPEENPQVALTAADYSLADFRKGEPIDGEAFRFLAVDVQQDHFWVLGRAFRTDGSSRLLAAARLGTWEQVRELQQRQKFPDRMVFVDCNYFPGAVYEKCAKYDWTAVEGDKTNGYPHTIRPGKVVVRYYSRVNLVAVGAATCRRIMFSRTKVTDEAVKLRSGTGPRWEHPIDVIEDWSKHIVSEKRELINSAASTPTFRYVRIAQRRNDLWWCEVACTLGGLMMGVLNIEDTTVEVPPADAAATE